MRTVLFMWIDFVLDVCPAWKIVKARRNQFRWRWLSLYSYLHQRNWKSGYTFNFQLSTFCKFSSLLRVVYSNFFSCSGLEDQGLYRLVGVSSKVSKLLSMGLDRRKVDKLNLEDRLEWENKTITSAIKTYLRQLPEPLMSFRYHTTFIAAASKSPSSACYYNHEFRRHNNYFQFFTEQESRRHRTADVHALVHKLPENHFKMLDILIAHLKKWV